MYDDDSLYWIWLADKCGPASKDIARLIGRFESPFEIYRLESEEIETLDFIGARLKSALSEKSLEGAYSILKYCKKNKVDIITYSSKKYPSRLRSLEDPPAVLYCLGRLPDLDRRLCIGVVGTRKISAYGMQTSYKISYEMAAANICVISGMALGVDAVAACGALEAGGDTVAVLGCGIDIVDPKAHAKLKSSICKSGAVITEFPPSEPPYGRNFPKRNRLISGLSQGVLIIEGNSSSGAMITAERAISQGREVFALPGKVNESNSEGPNELIKRGANVALCSEDIILHYDFLYHDTINYRGLKKASYSSEFSEEALEKYGVSTEVFYGASKNAQASEKPRARNRVTVREEVVSSAAIENVAPESDNEITERKDNSAELLDSLDSVTKRVFELMPLDRACTPDEFMSADIGIAEAITSLTLLEISGLAVSLPGGTYMRK